MGNQTSVGVGSLVGIREVERKEQWPVKNHAPCVRVNPQHRNCIGKSYGLCTTPLRSQEDSLATTNILMPMY